MMGSRAALVVLSSPMMSLEKVRTSLQLSFEIFVLIFFSTPALSLSQQRKSTAIRKSSRYESETRTERFFIKD